MSNTPATDIIREAEAVMELTIDELVYHLPVSTIEGYQRAGFKTYGQALELLAALEALQGNGYVDDEWFSVQDGGDYAYRIDRWIVTRYANGNRDFTEYQTEALAQEVTPDI